MAVKVNIKVSLNEEVKKIVLSVKCFFFFDIFPQIQDKVLGFLRNKANFIAKFRKNGRDKIV